MSTAKAKSVDVYSIAAEEASRLSALLCLSAESEFEVLCSEGSSVSEALPRESVSFLR